MFLGTKKTITILLFFSLVLNSIIVLLFYYCKIHSLENDSLEKIEAMNPARNGEETVLIIINKLDEYNTYNRLNEKEFTYRGSLYDIVSEYEIGDSTYIRCISDEPEQLFHSKFSRLDFEAPFKRAGRVNITFQIPVICSLLQNNNILFPLILTEKISAKTETAQSQHFSDIPAPPPKYFV